MRYGLLSTVAAAALSLSVAGAFAQGTGSSGAAGGSAGGSSTQQQMPPAQNPSGSQGTTNMRSGGSNQTQGTMGTTGGQNTSGSAQTQGSTGMQQPGATGSTSTTGSINLSPEERTQVTRVFSSVRTEPVNANFNVAVGTIVPTTVTTLHTCPSDVVRLINGLPECRYIVVRDKIVLVEPSSRRIVMVIDRQG